MTSSISNFKKRKSFISVTRRMSLAQSQSFVESECQPLGEQPEWHSLVLNANSFKRSSFTCAGTQKLGQSQLGNKENLPANRPVIRIKPRTSGGLVWLKQGGRSELIRLQRQSIHSYDE